MRKIAPGGVALGVRFSLFVWVGGVRSVRRCVPGAGWGGLGRPVLGMLLPWAWRAREPMAWFPGGCGRSLVLVADSLVS